ncbi:MAG: antitoxin [Candidatus Omnitrophica bacterium]|nr:antitoxin [Candidatus Omnitrophota bacterium]MCK4422764.1 antitoxin [Candidatus Omnitrophota bacterium]
MKKIILSKDEKKIEENILRYKPISPKYQKKIENIIKNANEKKNISLRVKSQDLSLIKIHAQEEGIPYQTFISSILHKFVTEQLIEQKNIIRSLRLLKSSS